MQVVKKTSEYTIYKRNDDRFAVFGPKRRRVNGEEKAEILKNEGLITLSEKKPEPEPEVEAEAEAGAEGETEAAAEGEEAAAE